MSTQSYCIQGYDCTASELYEPVKSYTWPTQMLICFCISKALPCSCTIDTCQSLVESRSPKPTTCTRYRPSSALRHLQLGVRLFRELSICALRPADIDCFISLSSVSSGCRSRETLTVLPRIVTPVQAGPRGLTEFSVNSVMSLSSFGHGSGADAGVFEYNSK